MIATLPIMAVGKRTKIPCMTAWVLFGDSAQDTISGSVPMTDKATVGSVRNNKQEHNAHQHSFV